MSSNKYFIRVLCFTVLLLLAPAGLSLFYDPFFIVHKSQAPLAGFSGSDRYQNAGLINSFLADHNEGYDTVIIGTSMSENLPVGVFKTGLGRGALKLTLAGGRPKELALMAQRAIETGNVKTVIWEIHRSYERVDPNEMHPKSPLPLFLYNDNRYDDWRYFFNHDVFEESFKLLRGKYKGRRPLADLYSWERSDQAKQFASEKSRIKHLQTLEGADLPIKSALNDLPRHKYPNIDQNLLNIIRENPSIEFILYFPPISCYAYARSGNNAVWNYILMRETLLIELVNIPNATVHSFDLVNAQTSDIKNYIDPAHYNAAISQKIAFAMVHKNQILTIRKWQEYRSGMINMINMCRHNFW